MFRIDLGDVIVKPRLHTGMEVQVLEPRVVKMKRIKKTFFGPTAARDVRIIRLDSKDDSR